MMGMFVLSSATVVKVAGMAVVAVILLTSSLAFGLFDDVYDLHTSYTQLYPLPEATQTLPTR